MLCKVPPEWIRTWIGTSGRGDSIHIPPEQWLVEQRFSHKYLQAPQACSEVFGGSRFSVSFVLCWARYQHTCRVFELLRYIPLSKHLVFSHGQVFPLLLCRAHRPSSWAVTWPLTAAMSSEQWSDREKCLCFSADVFKSLLVCSSLLLEPSRVPLPEEFTLIGIAMEAARQS